MNIVELSMADSTQCQAPNSHQKSEYSHFSLRKTKKILFTAARRTQRKGLKNGTKQKIILTKIYTFVILFI